MRSLSIAGAAGLALAAACALAQAQEVSADLVSQAQTSLAARGFSPGPADGRLTSQTINAIQQLQRTNNLPPTGSLDERTLIVLGLGAPAPAPVVTVPTFVPGTPLATPTPPPSAGLPGTGLPGTAPPGTNSLGGTPAGAPSPSFGATPAGAAPTTFTPTPAGAQSPTSGRR